MAIEKEQFKVKQVLVTEAIEDKYDPLPDEVPELWVIDGYLMEWRLNGYVRILGYLDDIKPTVDDLQELIEGDIKHFYKEYNKNEKTKAFIESIKE